MSSDIIKGPTLKYTERELVIACLNGDAAAQRELFTNYASTMLGVCRRYVKTVEEAEDILQEGFITVFTKLGQFKMEGSLEGWIRRIMVSRAIEYYRKKARIFPVSDVEGIEEELVSPDDVLSNISANELLGMISELPNMHRLVFNMYIFEDMDHNEIANELNIPVGTSKSTLFYARMMLRKRINHSMEVAKKPDYNEKRL
jgi:RNA polymerase sigma-70 factor (ECF subfamily)